MNRHALRHRTLLTWLCVATLVLAVGCASPTGSDRSDKGGTTTSGTTETPKATQPSQQPSGPQHGGTLVIAQPAEALNLDSRIDPKMEGIVVVFAIQEGLLMTNPKTGKPVPGLAEDWSVAPDGLTYTFKLRQGVKFHDGTDFDAEDVKFTFEFLTGERKGGAYVSQFKPYIAAVETPDPYTVVIRLTNPWEDFVTLLHKSWATLILSKDAVEQAGEKYGSEVVVGTGPFMFKSWAKGDSITVERNPNYWREGLPYLDGIVFKSIKEGSVRLVNVQAGTVDVVHSPPLDQVKSLQGVPGVRVVSAPGNPIVFIRFNTTTSPFDDRRLRQAIYYALDREQLVEAEYGEFATVASDLFPAWHWLHDPSHRGIERDLDRARQLLAEAGYGPGNPLEFDLTMYNEPEWTNLAVVIQAQLQDVGVKVNIRPMEPATLLAMERGEKGQNRDEYMATLSRLILPGSTTDDYIFKQYGGTGALNRTYYNHPDGFQDLETEELIHRARLTADRDQQRQLYRQAVERLTDAAVEIPIAFKKNVNVIRERVQDFYPQGTDVMPLGEIWIKK